MLLSLSSATYIGAQTLFSHLPSSKKVEAIKHPQKKKYLQKGYTEKMFLLKDIWIFHALIKGHFRYIKLSKNMPYAWCKHVHTMTDLYGHPTLTPSVTYNLPVWMVRCMGGRSADCIPDTYHYLDSGRTSKYWPDHPFTPITPNYSVESKTEWFKTEINKTRKKKNADIYIYIYVYTI